MRTKLYFAMTMLIALSAFIITGCEPDEPVNPVDPTPLVVPTVSTIEVIKHSPTLVTVVCLITKDGGTDITEGGIYYRNDTETPTIVDQYKKVEITGDAFSVELNVSPDKTYTVRAYAANKIGGSFGEAITFTTDELPPPEPRMADISDGIMLSRTSNSAYFSAIVLDSGYCHINEIGICWSKTGTPTIDDNRQAISTTNVGEFTVSANDLEKLTDYNARVYVTNIVGTNYGEPISFYTYDSVVDADGNFYYGVRIGNQVWLTENLKTTHFNNGDPIPYVTDDGLWTNANGPAYCWFDNDKSRANSSFGALYNWWVGTDPRGIAPEGYHIPTVEDFHEFGQYFGLNQIYYIPNTLEVHYYEYKGGKSLRTDYAWIPSCYGTNSSDFTCLPTGTRFSDGDYLGKNYYAGFWSSTSYDNISAWKFETGSESGDDGMRMQGKWIYKVYGKALRCVKD